MRLTSLALVLLAAAAGAAEHRIKPGEDPQAVLDAAAPGDKLAFLPGLHQHGLKKHRSILYVDKSVEIELMAGATLKLADGVCRKESIGEITTDQDSGKKIDDLEVGGVFDLKKNQVDGSELFGSTVYTIIVTGGKTGGPEENADYFRKKPTAEEVHRLEIGKILQQHLAANLPLPATVRLEALKLLSEACVIIDDEDLSPAALLAYYVQYVVPDLP